MTLLELLHLMRKNIKLVIVVPLICMLVTGIVSYAFLPDTYKATVSVYVLSSKSTQDTTASSSSSAYSNLSASQMLANDIATLTKSTTVKEKTASSLHMSDLSDYKIDVTSGTTTRVISISVTSTSAQGSATVANQIASELSNVAQSVMGAESVNVIDVASVPSAPSGPPRALYVLIALLAGLFIAIAIIVIKDLADTRVRSPEEAEELLGAPIIGRIPTIKN